jgi:hypothetical protein
MPINGGYDDDRAFLLSAYCYMPSQNLMAYTNQPKALFALYVCHVIFATKFV